MRAPTRTDGYAPIGDYGVIGNQRTAALVALDGSIDFFCAPRFDAPSIFAAVVDARRGGTFTLAPAVPYDAEHRYLPETNVLQTTFRTSSGTVRVTDALSVPLSGPFERDELVRKIEGLSGRVPMRWRLAPRFAWGGRRGEVERRGGAWAIRDGSLALVLSAWEAGEPTVEDGDLTGEIHVAEGDAPLLALSVFVSQPWMLPARRAVERRLEETCTYWRRWVADCEYDGPWQDAVRRSALALALLIHAPTGAMMAAVTTSLPERLGGSANFDYRYCWLRDTAFALEAMLQIGRVDQVHATLSWLFRVTATTNPSLQPFYRIDGSPRSSQIELGLEGYRGSVPVVEGNDAGDQLQLGNYGHLLQAAGMFVDGGHALGDASSLFPAALDYLETVWRRADASIWELPQHEDYTQGKLGAWTAFDRALSLIDRGELRATARQKVAWTTARAEIEAYVDDRCWSDERGAYLRAPGMDQLDASLLLAGRTSFIDGREDRFRGTVDAISDDLRAGDGLLYRYSSVKGEEGAFAACSFWMVEALAALGDVDRAAGVMEAALSHTSDLGLLSEEIDPEGGGLLGNLPQALSHLALMNAASAVEAAGDDGRGRRTRSPHDRAALRVVDGMDANAENGAIGARRWAIAEGHIPESSTGPAPEMTSHETACLLNTSDEDAQVRITLYFSDREPVGPYGVEVPARRTRHLRFNDLEEPEPVPRGTDYASVIESSVPIVVQHSRLDSRQAENALITTMAHPVG